MRFELYPLATRLLLFGVLLITLLLTTEVAARPVLQLNADQDHWSLAGYLSVGPVGDEVAVSELFEAVELFTPHSGIPAWGFSTEAHWLRFDIQANLPENSHWFLEVAPVFTDSLSLYWLDAQGQIQQLLAGDLIPAKQRPVDLPQQVFPLSLVAGENKTFLLRVQGTNPLFADIHLWESRVFLQETQKNNFYMSAYLAILFLMSVLGAIYSGLLKDQVHYFYTLYVLTQLCFQLAHSGYLGWLVDLPWPRFPDLLASAAISLSLGFFALLFIHLTRMRQDFPRLSSNFQRVTWLVTVMGLIGVAFDNYILVSPWIQLYILMLTGFAVAFSIYRLVTGEYRLGSAYLVVFGVLALGVILRILREQSLLPNNFWTENAMYLGTLVHLLVMQLMIITRIDQSRKNNEAEMERRVQQRTSELQERNEQLLTSHQQNLALQASLQQSLDKESEARQTQQDFLLMVSNEFRTPLAVIDGALTLLDMQQGAKNPNTTDWLERIRGAQQRLVSLVDTSLWDQRIADENWQPCRISIELLPWMIQLTENLRRMYNDKIITYQPGASIQLDVDPEMLQMLLQSLVDTLVFYLPAKSEVTLSLSIEQEQVLILVSTPDKDLLPELVGQLRKRYSNSHQRKSGGGLYLARAAARKLGGELEYKTSQQGASFVVTLPKETIKKVVK